MFTFCTCENAYEFLNETGEWYLDKHEGYLYYIPRQGEDMKSMEVKLPIGEEMIRAKGSSYARPLSHIAFENLMFEGTTWLRTEEYGGTDFLQDNDLSDQFSERNAETTDRWSLFFEACRYIDFTDCDFRHMGSAGASLMFYRAVKHVNMIGNEFYQLGGKSFQIDYTMNSSPQSWKCFDWRYGLGSVLCHGFGRPSPSAIASFTTSQQ